MELMWQHFEKLGAKLISFNREKEVCAMTSMHCYTRTSFFLESYSDFGIVYTTNRSHIVSTCVRTLIFTSTQTVKLETSQFVEIENIFKRHGAISKNISIQCRCNSTSVFVFVLFYRWCLSKHCRHAFAFSNARNSAEFVVVSSTNAYKTYTAHKIYLLQNR